jgi:hypothetical protein
MFRKHLTLLPLLLYAVVLASSTAGWSFCTTPTEKYLEAHPLGEIHSYLQNESEEHRLHFEQQLPLFWEIAAKEKTGFFGYHGCSQQYRLFQDVLKSVFLEIFQVEVPKDFQFLRIPGDPAFDHKEDVHSFYELFDRRQLSKDKQCEIIERLLLKPLFGKIELGLNWQDTLLEELTELFWPFIDKFADEMVAHSLGDMPFEEIETLSFPNQQKRLKAASNKYTSCFLKKLETVRQKAKSLNAKAPSLSFDPEIADKAYLLLKEHVANLPAKKVFSEKLKEQLSFSALSHALLANLAQGLSEDLIAYFEPYNDVRSEQQSHLVCLNIPLFGNFHTTYESSIHVFLRDRSVEAGDSRVEWLLKDFFAEIGLEKELVTQLFAEGKAILKENQVETGCLMQFFDLSAPFFLDKPFIDSVCYTSFWQGRPLKEIAPSQLIDGRLPLNKNHADLQLRLITANHSTLNPYSHLKILRYDALPSKEGERIIEQMRSRLREGTIDTIKKQRYWQKIQARWFNKGAID